jgi:hypothetical protein
MTLGELPKEGTAYLRSYNAAGEQLVALQYDLSKRRNRQAIISYYEHEISNGREAIITLDEAN